MQIGDIVQYRDHQDEPWQAAIVLTISDQELALKVFEEIVADRTVYVPVKHTQDLEKPMWRRRTLSLSYPARF